MVPQVCNSEYLVIALRNQFAAQSSDANMMVLFEYHAIQSTGSIAIRISNARVSNRTPQP
jgi:hypothetical protein